VVRIRLRATSAPFRFPRTRPAGRPEDRSRGFVADYKTVLSNPWARIVICAVFLESSFAWGAFAYIGADLNHRFGLGFTAVGLIIGCFALGGLVYSATVQQLVNRFGQAGLAVRGAHACRPPAEAPDQARPEAVVAL